MHTPRILAVTALTWALSGCAGTTPWSEVVVLDETGENGRSIPVDLLSLELDPFARWAATQGSRVQTVALVDPDITGDNVLAARTINGGRRIELNTGLRTDLLGPLRHELCHALDAEAGISSEGGEWLRRSALPAALASQYLEGHDQEAAEAFAVLCSQPLLSPIHQALDAQCSVVVEPFELGQAHALAFPGQVLPTRDLLAAPSRWVDVQLPTADSVITEVQPIGDAVIGRMFTPSVNTGTESAVRIDETTGAVSFLAHRRTSLSARASHWLAPSDGEVVFVGLSPSAEAHRLVAGELVPMPHVHGGWSSAVVVGQRIHLTQQGWPNLRVVDLDSGDVEELALPGDEPGSLGLRGHTVVLDQEQATWERVDASWQRVGDGMGWAVGSYAQAPTHDGGTIATFAATFGATQHDGFALRDAAGGISMDPSVCEARPVRSTWAGVRLGHDGERVLAAPGGDRVVIIDLP